MNVVNSRNLNVIHVDTNFIIFQTLHDMLQVAILFKLLMLQIIVNIHLILFCNFLKVDYKLYENMRSVYC